MNKKTKSSVIISFLPFVLFMGCISSCMCEKNAFLKEPFCQKQNSTDYSGHYSLFKLKCDWYPFLSYFERNVSNTINKNDIFEIEFYKKTSYGISKPSPYEIKENLFKKFTIRKLKFSGLSINKIYPNAFKGCCEDTLEYLDLSNNKLKRIDFDALSNLKVLHYLDLSLNPDLQLTSENFKENIYLKHINLSSINLQYLPDKLFSNLNYLQTIDLSNNSLRYLDSCTFYPIYHDLKRLDNLKSESNLSYVIINALVNNIECNCDVFYLERAANIKLDLVCSGQPKYYNGKHISTLKNEDPSGNECSYNEIEFTCKSKYEDSISLLKNYHMFKVLMIVFICLFFAFCLLSLCLWCRVRKLNGLNSEESRYRNKKSIGHSFVSRSNAKADYKELQHPID